MIRRLIQAADTFAHLPVIGRIVPNPVRRWLCDRMDLSLGATPEEIARTTRC